MSPYRVTVVQNSTHQSYVLSAMLSINKKTGDRNIYIIRKERPELFGTASLSDRQLAYSQTCRSNSSILSNYRIHTTANDKYRIGRYNMAGACVSYIHDVEYTQSRCLASAMNDYCIRNGYTIISVL